MRGKRTQNICISKKSLAHQLLFPDVFSDQHLERMVQNIDAPPGMYWDC